VRSRSNFSLAAFRKLDLWCVGGTVAIPSVPVDGIAAMNARGSHCHVRYWHLADINPVSENVRFWG